MSPKSCKMHSDYKKRPGTSGISGHLYETKLISLILFRLLHDDNVEDFCLACNMDDIGEFDDICLKITIKGTDRPITAFMQVKHKDNDDTCVPFEHDSAKWCKSFTRIREKFNSSKIQNEIICGEYSEDICQFILYTNANYNFDSNPEDKTSAVNTLNTILATSVHIGSRLTYTNTNIDRLSEIITSEEIKILAKNFANYLTDDSKQSMNIMNDEYILQYHVILANEFVNVSEVQLRTKPDLKYRELRLKDNTRTGDKYIKLFKEFLYDHIIKSSIEQKRTDKVTENKIDSLHKFKKSTGDDLISIFLSEPCARTLSPLIETYITLKNTRLEFITERPHSDLNRLEQINISSSEINKAKEIAVNKILQALKIVVPVAFGNKDLAIRGNHEKIEKRLAYLTGVVVTLCQKFQECGSYKIVTIDDTIDKAILSSNGGLGGTVGNILVYDKVTKLLMFTESSKPLEINAKSLLLKLENKISNFETYRFHIKTKRFPKLTFDCSDKAKAFLNQLLLYPKQSNHKDLDKLLKKEMDNHLPIHMRGFKTDLLFLYYHNEVQKWWMTPKSAPYLTKKSNVYYHLIKNIDLQPQIFVLENTFYMNNIKYFSYTFKEAATKCLKRLETLECLHLETIITRLSTVKIIQYLRNKCFALDLYLILHLSTEEFSILSVELKNTERTPVIICENLKNISNIDKRLRDLKKVMEKKKIIVITNEECTEIICDYFSTANNIIYIDDHYLVDMNPESQKEIIEKSRAIFQGRPICLSSLIDEVTVKLIKGAVLDNLIKQGHIAIGGILSDTNYDEIKDLYIDRRISQVSDSSEIYIESNNTWKAGNQHNRVPIETFYDIKEDFVLIIGKAGMGKSTLLSHLSIKTKELYENIWIVRINLIYHSKMFNTWEENSTEINILLAITFLCRIVQDNNKISINIKETENKVYLEDTTGDDCVDFVLKMFLHFYNNRKIILLFDGFDEICPDYKEIVLKLLNIFIRQKIKLWVATRPCSEVLTELKLILNKLYVLEFLSKAEQDSFVDTYLSKIVDQKPRDITKAIEKEMSNAFQEIKEILSNKSPEENGTVDMVDNIASKYSNCYFLAKRYGMCHLALHIILPRESIPQIDFDITDFENKSFSTPLLLTLYTDKFIGNLWQGDIKQTVMKYHIFIIYWIIVETKLKKLYYDKYLTEVYNPFLKIKYREERAKCLSFHKKLAAHELFGSPLFNKYVCFDEFKYIGPFVDMKEHESMMEKVWNNSDETVFISTITEDKRPVFTHRTFLEYFAIEFLVDIIKDDKYEANIKSLLLSVLIKYNFDVFLTIIQKSLWDEELDTVLNVLADPQLLFPCYKRLTSCRKLLSYEQYERLLNSTADDYELFYEISCDSDCDDETSGSNDINTFRYNKNIVDKMKPHLKKYFV